MRLIEYTLADMVTAVAFHRRLSRVAHHSFKVHPGERRGRIRPGRLHDALSSKSAVEVVGPRQSWPLEMHLARTYVASRFALVGDAAHGVHPIAGQGVNLAFRDVAALGEVIVDALRLGLDPGSLQTLGRYERWRRFDSFMSAAAFDGLNKLFSNDSVLIRAARDFGLGLVDRLPGLKRRLVHEAAGLTGDLPRLFKSERL